jgi:hypothetical protein
MNKQVARGLKSHHVAVLGLNTDGESHFITQLASRCIVSHSTSGTDHELKDEEGYEHVSVFQPFSQ